MPLPEIEFELTASQYERMGFPGLRQGQPLSVVLDAGVLLPDVSAEGWYTVQKEPLPPRFVNVGPAWFAFSGQIIEAELLTEEDEQTGVLTIDCGVAPLRVTCAPQADGRLPYGAWETRHLAGIGRVVGVVEDDFRGGVGQTTDVTIWRFRRLILRPGDPLFGQWHESAELAPLPFHYDRIVVTARVHRRGI
jgi:hypothetical protein